MAEPRLEIPGPSTAQTIQVSTSKIHFVDENYFQSHFANSNLISSLVSGKQNRGQET